MAVDSGSGQVGVALVGTGYWGKNLLRNFADLGALRLVCDQDASRLAEQTAGRPELDTTTSFEVVLDSDVEAVAIATPAALHFDHVRRALEAGKHVFVEKPLALTYAEGQALVRLAEDKARIMMVGHILEYHPAVTALDRLVADGELGTLRYIYSNRLNLGKVRQEENILWSFAPHDIAVICRLAGQSPRTVAASGSSYLQPGIVDVTVTNMAFDNGIRSHVFVSWLHPFKEQKLVVVGDRKMAVFDDRASDKLRVYDKGIEWENGLPVARQRAETSVHVPATEPLRIECQAFLDAVATGEPPLTDGPSALRVLAVLEAAQLSLEASGAPTEVARASMLADHSVATDDGPVAGHGPPGVAPDVMVHPTAVVDAPTQIGSGTKIWHFSHVMSDALIGEGCNLGQNVFVASGVRLGSNVKVQNNVSLYTGVDVEDDVFLGPSMVFTNVINPRSHVPRRDTYMPTKIRTGASVGANATIVCGTTLGRYAFVGAGAVVTRDVPDFAIVYGNPARIRGWMCVCGEGLTFDEGGARCIACGREYQEVTIDSETRIRLVADPVGGAAAQIAERAEEAEIAEQPENAPSPMDEADPSATEENSA